MDNKQAIAATLGIGAIGSILAYYGYNNLSTTQSNEPQENNSIAKNDGIGSTLEQKENSMNSIKEQVAEEIKNTVNKLETESINKVNIPTNDVSTSEWSKFWSGQYKINTTPKAEN